MGALRAPRPEEDGGVGEAPFILERLLPGQRVAAAEWFQYVKEMLVEAKLENFENEPTLFRGTGPDDDTNLILHADDGILASTPEARGSRQGAGGPQEEGGGESQRPIWARERA